MKLFRQTFAILSLMLVTSALNAQASWGYSIYFKIADEKGAELTPEEFEAKGYQLYDRGRDKSELTYSEKTGYYHYRMSNTIYSLDYLVLLNKKDTIVLEHNTYNWIANEPIKVNGKDITFRMISDKKNPNHFITDDQNRYSGKVVHLSGFEQKINPLQGFRYVPFYPEATTKKGKRPKWL